MATDKRVKESLRKSATKSAAPADPLMSGQAEVEATRPGRARGLGRSFADIFAEQAPPEQRSESSVTYGYGNDRQMMGGINAVISTGTDLDPYFVEEADQYFQGPRRSTRVAAHQFIPTNSRGGTDADSVMGNIYVRFQRKTGGEPGDPGDLWRYGPVNVTAYRSFRETFSKGRAVRQLEGYGHGRANEGTPGILI
jgi:hypothetical protein